MFNKMVSAINDAVAKNRKKLVLLELNDYTIGLQTPRARSISASVIYYFTLPVDKIVFSVDICSHTNSTLFSPTPSTARTFVDKGRDS